MFRRFSLPYGQGFSQVVDINETHLLGVLEHRDLLKEQGKGLSVEASIATPIASPRLNELVVPGEKVAVITSDITRPFPTKKVLPLVLAELAAAGIQEEDITIVLALGNHRPHTEDEKVKLVGSQIYNNYTVIDSDSSDTVTVGISSRGTPLEIFRPLVKADRRILLGNVEYHYFAGYSGGLKAIVPGCSSHKTIQKNHSHMIETGAVAGSIEGNPVRQDLEEIIKFLPVDFIVNVVLDENKNILSAFSGHPIRAHRQAACFLDSIYQLPIPCQAEIVIASAGGYPKDINLYQAQKAIDNASQAVRPGGIIILVASCQEGPGDEVFTRWAREASSPEELLRRVQRDFELGGHKAAAIARYLEKAQIFLVSDMEPTLVKEFYLTPFSDLSTAYKEARARLGDNASVWIIPQAGSVFPKLDGEKCL